MGEHTARLAGGERDCSAGGVGGGAGGVPVLWTDRRGGIPGLAASPA